MGRVEWWYEIDPGFVAPADLLDMTFPTEIAGYAVTIHMPSMRSSEGTQPVWNLGAPRLAGRPQADGDRDWGMVHMFGPTGPEGVVVSCLGFTAELPDHVDTQPIADAMDSWWESVSAWLEIVTGQQLTRVGHHKTEYIGNKTPIWPLNDDGSHGLPFPYVGTTTVATGLTVPGVTADVFCGSVALGDQQPAPAWILLRDARSLRSAGQYRRGVIDAATAAELAVADLLSVRLQGCDPEVRKALLDSARMLGPKGQLLPKLGCPNLPQAFVPDLVEPRNAAVHMGHTVTLGDCDKAIAVAAEVVERAFPLPTPAGASQSLQRLW